MATGREAGMRTNGRRLRLVCSPHYGAFGFPPGPFLSPLAPVRSPAWPPLAWAVWPTLPLRVTPGDGRLPRLPERPAAVLSLSFDSDRRHRIRYTHTNSMSMNCSCEARQVPLGQPATLFSTPELHHCYRGAPLVRDPAFSCPSSMTDRHWKLWTRTYRHG